MSLRISPRSPSESPFPGNPGGARQEQHCGWCWCTLWEVHGGGWGDPAPHSGYKKTGKKLTTGQCVSLLPSLQLPLSLADSLQPLNTLFPVSLERLLKNVSIYSIYLSIYYYDSSRNSMGMNQVHVASNHHTHFPSLSPMCSSETWSSTIINLILIFHFTH